MEFTLIDEEKLIDPKSYNPNEEKLNNIKRKIPFSYYCISLDMYNNNIYIIIYKY